VDEPLLPAGDRAVKGCEVVQWLSHFGRGTVTP
jgi:hypothetical protein